MVKKKYDPDEIVHVQVAEGARVVYDGKAYGHRATLQVKGREVEDVVAQGAEVVDPNDVPDVAERHDPGDARQPGP
jgi:hypothetical protein